MNATLIAKVTLLSHGLQSNVWNVKTAVFNLKNENAMYLYNVDFFVFVWTNTKKSRRYENIGTKQNVVNHELTKWPTQMENRVCPSHTTT